MRLLTTTLSLIVAAAAQHLLAQEPTNTLLVVMDDVGIDLLASYGVGGDPAPTPTLDALVARGVRFERAYACPTCSPTRAAAMSGRYGLRTGVGMALGANVDGLARSEVILPELLASRGVASALIGKWHLGDEDGARTPTLDGFGIFVGSLQGAVQDYERWAKVENARSQLETTYATTDLVDELADFVAGVSAPWCAVLAFHAAHSPWHEPPAHLHTQDLSGLDPQRDSRAFAKAMLQALDTELGRLFAEIGPVLLARTNVLVIGDNGSAPTVAGAPFDRTHAKGTLYEGGIRVPLIAAGPAVLRHGEVEGALVHAVDLFATIAALHGVDARATVPSEVPLDSLSFAALLQAPGASARRTVYTEQFATSPWTRESGDGEAVLDASWKLLRRIDRNGTEREELYELASDPFEAQDLLLLPLDARAESAYLELRDELARLRGEAWVASYGTACPSVGAPTLRAATTPLLGATFSGQVIDIGSSATSCLLWLGFDRAHWGGIPLPFDLEPLGFTGCALHAAPEIALTLPMQQGLAVWSFTLPGDLALSGFGAQLQALVPDAQANLGGAAFSRALTVRLGAR